MKTLATVLLLTATATSVALAQPAPHGPDFLGSRDARWVDRTLAASDGTSPIEPSDIIGFRFDRSALDDAAVSQIEAAAQWLRAHPDHRVVVEGHTDIIGSADYNQDLGRRRADRVRGYLMRLGIDSDRILVVVVGARDAHQLENENDRRVVLFASPLRLDQLAAAELDASKAMTAAWSVHGALVEEQNGIAAAALPATLSDTHVALAAIHGADTVVVPPTRGFSRTVEIPDELQPIEPLELIGFDRGSAELGPAEHHQLALLARWMKRYPEQHLVLDGHADHPGDVDLATRRADNVRDQLRGLGVAPDRVVIAALGGEADLADRRVLVLASDRPVRELVVALERMSAPTIVWTERGRQHVTSGAQVSSR